MKRWNLKDYYTVYLNGVKDSWNLLLPLKLILKSRFIMRKVLETIGVSGILFIGSILVYNKILFPLFSHISSITGEHVYIFEFLFSMISHLLWLYPLYLISFTLTTFWTQDIFDEALKILSSEISPAQPQKRPEKTAQKSTQNAHEKRAEKPSQKGSHLNLEFKHKKHSLHSAISNLLSRCIIMLIYLLELQLLSQIPVLGRIIEFVLLTWLYSYYCFEYRTFAMGINTLRSLSIFEWNSVYFCGFGMSFTVILLVFPGLMSCAVFCLLFPFVVLTSLGVTVQQEGFKTPIFALCRYVHSFIMRYLKKIL